MGVDINAALGADAAKQFGDQTHHVEYGSYLQSKCIALGIKQDNLPLAKYIVGRLRQFRPATSNAVAGQFRSPA